ncbi:MAG: hypothetical protein HC809_03195 [Gammaproteobacteria bacterium]|nr:hypothetical protein [Gammaproteobacteria bacterium]
MTCVGLNARGEPDIAGRTTAAERIYVFALRFDDRRGARCGYSIGDACCISEPEHVRHPLHH